MKRILFALLVLTSNQIVFSQEDQEDIDYIIDSVIEIDDDDLLEMISDLNKYQIIYASVEYNNKTYFLGRDIGIDQFNINPQIMYEHSNGIYLGVSGNYYSEFDPEWDVTTLTAGYGLNFGKEDNFRVELGYSRHIFSDSNSNDFKNSIDASLSAATKNDAFGSMARTSYFFGNKTGLQSSLSVYGNLKITDINVKKESKLVFAPDLSFIFGRENIDTSRIDNLGIDLPFINYIVNSFETFSLRNIQLQLPLILDLNNFNIEIGYNFNFPQELDFENNVDNTSFFNLELNYIFNLN